MIEIAENLSNPYQSDPYRVVTEERFASMRTTMDHVIAVGCIDRYMQLDGERQIAKSNGEYFPTIPPTYEDDLVDVETRFGNKLVLMALTQVERAKAAAKETGVPIRRLVLRTDLDGTLVPWGFEDRDQLREGFTPAVRVLQFLLAQDGIEVGVEPLSDRPQATLDEEAPQLLAPLAEDGTLGRSTSAKDGLQVRAMSPELLTQQTNHTDKEAEVLAARTQAVTSVMKPEAVAGDGYHEKAAILAEDAAADPSVVHVAIDDLSFAAHLTENPRVGGMSVGGKNVKGRLQPLTPNDVFRYPPEASEPGTHGDEPMAGTL